ncbi:MAG TPA: hydrogenase nickel incorporation protein HypA [Spirochaetia bacterium]|nr:hydrogenase nickel incorporation protein HypA [Spirochaetia bacterium]
MHEWALAEAVVEATASALETRNPACLRGVTVSVGELQAIDHEIFTFALNTLREQRPFRQAVYRLETEPARLRCGACGTEWGLSETAGLDSESREAIHFLPEAAHAFVRCPRCASPDFQVTAGRGVRIISITVDASGSCAEGPASP